MLMGANGIKGAEAGKALGGALAANTVLKELDLSGNAANPDGSFWSDADGPGFAQELAVGVKNNGALAKLTFGGNGGDYYDLDKKQLGV